MFGKKKRDLTSFERRQRLCEKREKNAENMISDPEQINSSTASLSSDPAPVDDTANLAAADNNFDNQSK